MSKIVPKVRFEGFFKDWDLKNMKSIANVLDGDRGKNYPSEKDLLLNGHTAFLNASNVTKTGFSFNSIQYISEDKSNLMGNGKICLNDLIITSRGTLGNVALYDYEINSSMPFARINSGMLILRVFTEYSPYFLLQHLNSQIGKKQIKLMSFGSAQPQLTKKDVSNYKISIPKSKEEQQKIGDFFKQLDDIIALQQQLVEQQQQYKKAMLQKMFPQKGERVPKVRFYGFSEEWEERRAENIFKSISDKNHEELPVLSATQNKGMVYRDEVGIDIKFDEKSKKTYKRVIPNQFVIHLRSFQGGFAFSDKEGITSPAYTILDFKIKNQNNPVFWKEILRSQSFIKRLETVTYGIRDGRSISYSDFSTLKFLVPSLEEQQKIGTFFEQIDDTISLHQKKHEDYQQLKKALSQRMFA